MEYTVRQLEHDIFKRYKWFDSLFGKNATKDIVDGTISLSTAISISRFYSVIPNNDVNGRRSFRSCISEIMPIAFSTHSNERIKIIGPIKKYYFFPIVIRALDLPFVQKLTEEQKLTYTQILVPVKMFVDPKRDLDLIKHIKSFGHRLQNFYAFNCFRPIERSIGESNIWIAEIPIEVGKVILDWQSQSGIDLSKSNSPALTIEYLIQSKKTMDFTVRFEKDDCPLSEDEARILKRTGKLTSEDKFSIPISKQGYINTDYKYRKSEFQAYRSYYEPIIKRGYGYGDTDKFFRNEVKRIMEDDKL